MNRSCLRLLGFEVFVAHINSNSCGVEVCVLVLNPLWKMAESMSMGASIRKWVVENKLRSVGTFLVAFYLFIYFLQFSVKTENPFGFGFSFGFCFLILFDLMESGKGCLWLSGIGGSIAYNWSQPGMKTSVKIIHARYGLFYFYFFCFLYLLCLFAFVWVVVELCGSEAPSVCFSGKNGEGK